MKRMEPNQASHRGHNLWKEQHLPPPEVAQAGPPGGTPGEGNHRGVPLIFTNTAYSRHFYYSHLNGSDLIFFLTCFPIFWQLVFIFLWVPLKAVAHILTYQHCPVLSRIAWASPETISASSRGPWNPSGDQQILVFFFYGWFRPSCTEIRIPEAQCLTQGDWVRQAEGGRALGILGSRIFLWVLS